MRFLGTHTVPVTTAALVCLWSASAGATEFVGTSATAAALGGAQVGAHEDGSAPLGNPATLSPGKLLAGAGSSFLTELTAVHQPIFRAAFATSLSERITAGIGIGPDGYYGCSLACSNPGFASVASYRLALASSFRLLDEPGGSRASIAFAYRPRFDFWSGNFSDSSTRPLVNADSTSVSWGELSIGATYSPVPELNLGLLLSGGTATSVSTQTPDGASVGSFSYKAAPQATLGVEFELDQWLARFDYSLTHSFGALLVFTNPQTGPRVTLGDAASPTHKLRLGVARRIAVGRNELSARAGAAVLSEPGAQDTIPTYFLPSLTPTAQFTLGFGFSGRVHELAIAGVFSTPLGEVHNTRGYSFLPLADKVVQLSLDYTAHFGD